MSDDESTVERQGKRRDPFEGQTGDNDLPDTEDIGHDDRPEDQDVVGAPPDWDGGASMDRSGGAGESPSTPGGLDGPSTGQGGG